MLSDGYKAEIDDFLTQAARLGVDDFTAIRQQSLGTSSVCKPAYALMKLPASDFSWIDKLARDAIGPLLANLEWPDTRVASRAVGLTIDAARAIVRRDRLSAEQYEAFVGGFRQVGVTLPDHPSTNGSGEHVASLGTAHPDPPITQGHDGTRNTTC